MVPKSARNLRAGCAGGDKRSTGGNSTGALSKIDQLVADATTELKRLEINIDGKRPDQLLTMAREERKSPVSDMLVIDIA